ncbi:MAG TPA: hypothetical protein VFZ66_16705 [Herpetosiphonaceae bacterium]
MRWKFYIPHTWDTPRTIWEDVYLLPDDPECSKPPIWLTLDAIGGQTYAGHGMRKAEYKRLTRTRFAERGYWIEGCYMCVHANTFSKDELLAWVHVWLHERGFTVSELVEVALEDLEPTGDHHLLRTSMRCSSSDV